MRGSDHFGPVRKQRPSFAAIFGIVLGLAWLSSPACAQINGTWPSVLSIPVSHFSPNPAPSVTSLGPFGYGRGIPSNLGSTPNIQQYPFRQFPYTRPHSRGNGRGNASYGYAIPYYVPYDASGYGYDYVGGGDQYSAPPAGPTDYTLHIVVEQPPVPPHPYRNEPAPETSFAPERRPESQQSVPGQQSVAPVSEEHSIDPTVLVFRDGHKQEVSNYAIMGSTVYVFDEHTKKIALAELDVPATVKANDDRGLEFQLPPQAPAPRKDTTLPKQKTAPATSNQKPGSVV